MTMRSAVVWVAVLGTSACAGLAHTQPAPGGRRPAPGGVASTQPQLPKGVLSLKYRTTDNVVGSTDELRGKLIAVLFFAPDQAGTADALEAVAAAVDALEGSGVRAIGVCTGRDRAALTPHLNTLRGRFPVHFDDRGTGAGLARQWRVTTTPWVVLLDPDARAAWAGPPAALGDRLRAQLALTPPRAVGRAVLAAAVDALTLAEARLSDGEPRAAARYLAALPPEARADPAVAERLAALTSSLETALPQLIELSDRLFEAGDIARSVLLMEQCVAALRGTPGEARALDQLHSFTDDPELKPVIDAGRPEALASDLLDAASDFESRGDLATAYRLCRQVVSDHPATSAAEAARARLDAWDADPALKRRLRDSLWGKPADAALTQADNYRRSNLLPRARELYQQLIHDYPGTTAAEKAEAALKTLK